VKGRAQKIGLYSESTYLIPSLFFPIEEGKLHTPLFKEKGDFLLTHYHMNEA